MAKQAKKEEKRDLTRKQQVHHRRDAQQNRRVLIALGVVSGLLLILIGAGVLQELVLKPRQPIATVNGSAISSQDYAKLVKFDWFQQGPQQQQDPTQLGQQVLDSMVDQELIREQARQRGITVSQDELDQAIEKYFGYLRNTPTPSPTPSVSPTPTLTPTPSPQPTGTPSTPSPTSTPAPTSTPMTKEGYDKLYTDYTANLQKQVGMSQSDFRNWVEGQLLTQKLYESVSKDVPAAEEQVHARHILINIVPEPATPTPVPTGQPVPTATAQPTPGGPTPVPTEAPRSDTEALARATEVKQKLDQGGDFAKLAEEYSDDPGSKSTGGDLSWFGKGRMMPEFEQAAFSLQPGQTSDPIKTSYGYHIIQVLEKDPQHAIDEYTLQQRKYDEFTKWLSSVRDQAKITRNWSLDKMPPTPTVAQ